MSTLRVNNLQIGQSGTAAQNFTLYQPSTPDGTVRLAVGNSGATTGDVLSVSGTGLSVTGTLSATGNVTLSGGTANGVLYLNGSKVATTGSALTFNGSTLYNSGNISVGGNSGGNRYVALLNETNTYTGTLMLQAGGGSAAYGGAVVMYGASHASYPGAVYIGASSDTSTGVIFGKGGNAGPATSEQMRLDSSGNLGLGVTPSAGWDSFGVFQLREVGAFASNNFGGGNTQTFIGNNVYYGTSSYRYLVTGSGAARYALNGNSHAWFTAPSGTANTAITFTQAMTLDASGNLIVGGTNAPSIPITSFKAIAANNDATTGLGLVRFGTTYGSNLYHTYTTNAGSGNDGEAFGLIVGDGSAALTDKTKTKYMVTQNGTHIWYGSTTSTERARITSGGYLGISTSSPQNYIDLGQSSNGQGLTWSNYSNIFSEYSSGALILSSNYYGNIGSGGYKTAATATFGAAGIQVSGTSGSGTSGLIQFFVDPATSKTAGNAFTPTERARITSGGDLLVGATSAYGKVTVQQTASSQTLYLYNSNATTAYGMQIYYAGRSPNSTGEEFIFCGDSAQRFAARSNGGLANYSANNVNLSDRREKTNFAPAKSYLNTICAIPVQTFNYIDQSEDDPGLTLGVVAQDVQAVAPELVMESNWGTKEDPKMRLSIYQTDLQYALMKCIQEQQALITSLTARVATLEGTQP